MNRVLKFSAVVSIVLGLGGCNIYRQVVLPTPYYPQGEQASIGTPVTSQPLEQIQQQQNQTASNGFTPTPKQSSANVNSAIVQRIPFSEAEYSSLSRTGNGRVVGSIYLTTPSGHKIYGKQTRLYLNPVTSYSTQWYEKSYLGGAKMSKVDPRLFNYLKFTTSDNNGKFEFLNVPSGSYYLIGVVKCGAECGYDRVKNIRIAKKISVFGNSIKSVDLSKELQ